MLLKKEKNLFLSTIALPLLFVAFSSSCTKADLQYGSQLAGDQYTNIVMTDTFTTLVSTVYIDSFITSASGAALMGSYYDEAFGQISTSSYVQFSPPTFSDKNVVYDSLELVIKPNGNYYGDTLQPLSLQVFQLSQAISKTNSTSWYNYDSVSHYSTPLGEKTQAIYPHITDSVSIRLSDNLGNTLLNLLKNSSDEVSSTTNFLNYFKGVCITSPAAKAAIISCKDTMEIRLHYKETSGTIAQSKTAVFSFYNNADQFNRIVVNRTGTALAAIGTKNKTLSSSITNNAGYLQSATGSLVKLRVPYIRDILTAPNYLKIERAVLMVKPVNGTFSGYYRLPSNLRLTTTTKNNDYGADIVYSDGSIQYGELATDELYGENTVYTYDITDYLTGQASVSEINENGLLLRPAADALTTQFERAIIGDANNTTTHIQLQIYYLTVQ